MITAVIKTNDYVVKTVHHTISMKNIRVIVPKKWDVEHVNVVLWEEDKAELKITNPKEYRFTIPECKQVFLKRVIKDEKRHYVYLPVHYDGKQVLIVPA